ncbi:MAG TPA: GuaB3 family IMP dehydrogenase-related protein [Armatimonadota bacterium]|jgi:IMP dehydrogenase
MAIEIGRNRMARQTYGFDEVALVPGAQTIDPELVDVSWQLGNLTVPLPIVGASLDALVDPKFAITMGKLGGMAMMYLEGVQTKYDNPQEAIDRIVQAGPEEVVSLIQDVYRAPIKDELILQRIAEVKAAGVPVMVSTTPLNAARIAKLIGPGGVDVFSIISTVTTVRHIAERYTAPDFAAIKDLVQCPLVIGNCGSYEGAYELMAAGADAVLVGIGPGAICTTRRVCGLGVPQVTATADCAAARDDYERLTGRRVAVITDGGMRSGGDICKAIAAGADAVMLGSQLAASTEAPAKGFSWGMATSSPTLPRGTRIQVGTRGTLEEILLGPAKRDDGLMNYIGALKLSMGSIGARNLREMQKAELIVAPSMPTEGKTEQRAQRVGMGR